MGKLYDDMLERFAEDYPNQELGAGRKAILMEICRSMEAEGNVEPVAVEAEPQATGAADWMPTTDLECDVVEEITAQIAKARTPQFIQSIRAYAIGSIQELLRREPAQAEVLANADAFTMTVDGATGEWTIDFFKDGQRL